ncbi:MAG: hypothetical protein V4438_04280 [Patescibacteria group bacterium]
MKGSKGQISISLGLAWAGIVAIISMISSYYTTNSSITDKVNNSASALNAEISSDRQDIASLKTSIEYIKDSQAETRNDVKTILKILK